MCKYMMIKSSKYILLFLFAALPFTARAAGERGVSVSSSVDRSKITIGDLITYTIQVTHPDSVQVEMPGPAANLGGFEIRDYSLDEPRKNGAIIEHQASYKITAFFTGQFTIPPVTVYYKNAADSAFSQISTDAIDITVESMKASEAGDIRDIKPPRDIPSDYRRLLLILGGALFIVLLAVTGIILYRRWKAGKGILPSRPEVKRPPHEVALEELERLRQEELWRKGEVVAYYIRLSETIRRYIEGRYFVPAMEMTSEEVLERLEPEVVEEEDLGLFRDFFTAADLVKFAKFLPGIEAHHAAWDTARNIVERTRIVLPEPEPESDPEEQKELREPVSAEETEEAGS